MPDYRLCGEIDLPFEAEPFRAEERSHDFAPDFASRARSSVSKQRREPREEIVPPTCLASSPTISGDLISPYVVNGVS